jgi:hypothetical protein
VRRIGFRRDTQRVAVGFHSRRQRRVGGDERAAPALPDRKLRIGIEAAAQSERRGEVVFGEGMGADEAEATRDQKYLW